MAKFLVITGGSRGIGEQTILRFLSAGWQAINLSRTPAKINSVHHFTVDLQAANNLLVHSEALQALLNDAEQIALVQNAAFYQPDKLDTLTITNLRHTLEINLVAPIVLNQMVLPWMKAGSSIIYIGTTLAEKAVPGSASYTISKHGLVGLMRATCQDLMDKNIHTVCINPGLVETQLLHETVPAETVQFLLENKIIGKRLIKPEEIAELIYFFANTNLVNGVCIAANTGQVAE